MNQESPPPQNLATGRLASSVANLSGSSRAIPSREDFYYYRNFDEFKVPIEEMARQSQSMLQSIGSSAISEMAFPQEDLDDAYDWLVNVNDDVLERVDASLDEFKKKDEEGFQLVSGKKKKDARTISKPKVSFHVPSIRKPQEEFNILVNNSNQPFEHVWLERSDDAQRFLHPLVSKPFLSFHSVSNNSGLILFLY